MITCRFFKAVGLGFKTPLEAKEGTYIDKKCPWTGNISIRGKLLRGVVVSTKMKRFKLFFYSAYWRVFYISFT